MNIQKEHQFENLVFKGGGVRAFAYCGAIKKLEEMGKLDKIHRFAGTSAGAIFAVLLAIGMSADEIMRIKDEIRFDSLKLGCWTSTMYKVWNHYGIFDSSTLEQEFRDFISEHVNPDITFKDLFDKTNNELVIVATNYNRMVPVYFHHAQYPNVKVVDALMMSISVPFVFHPRKYTLYGTEYIFVDGGLTDNYAIWVFNDMDRLYNGRIGEVDKNPVSRETLGLKLLASDQTNTFELYDVFNRADSVLQYGAGLVNTLMTQIERTELSTSYLNQTIPIKTDSVFFLNFHITHELIEKLVQHGVDAVDNYCN